MSSFVADRMRADTSELPSATPEADSLPKLEGEFAFHYPVSRPPKKRKLPGAAASS